MSARVSPVAVPMAQVIPTRRLWPGGSKCEVATSMDARAGSLNTTRAANTILSHFLGLLVASLDAHSSRSRAAPAKCALALAGCSVPCSGSSRPTVPHEAQQRLNHIAFSVGFMSLCVTRSTREVRPSGFLDADEADRVVILR
jgi:hypothetical protein